MEQARYKNRQKHALYWGVRVCERNQGYTLNGWQSLPDEGRPTYERQVNSFELYSSHDAL